jgi:hypothetical protein
MTMYITSSNKKDWKHIINLKDRIAKISHLWKILRNKIKIHYRRKKFALYIFLFAFDSESTIIYTWPPFTMYNIHLYHLIAFLSHFPSFNNTQTDLKQLSSTISHLPQASRGTDLQRDVSGVSKAKPIPYRQWLVQKWLN